MPIGSRAKPSDGTVIQSTCISPGISIRAIARYLETEPRKVRLLARSMGLPPKERYSRMQAREILFAFRAQQGARLTRLKTK